MTSKEKTTINRIITVLRAQADNNYALYISCRERDEMLAQQCRAEATAMNEAIALLGALEGNTGWLDAMEQIFIK